MQIKYVGGKPEETAFSRDTGVTWCPGDSHDIPDVHARKMLQHPDVFAHDEGAAKSAKKPAPAPAPVSLTSTSNAPASPAAALDAAATTNKTTLAPGKAIGAANETNPPPEGAPMPDGEFVVKDGEGWAVLDTMEQPELHALAKKLGVKVHPNSGAPKVIEALMSQKPAKSKGAK